MSKIALSAYRAMALDRSGSLGKRQSNNINDNDNNGPGAGYGYGGDRNISWWWTPAGLAVRYAIVAGLFIIILLYFVGGYLHAKRRVKKGLVPYRYHRWMLRSPAYPRAPHYPAPRPVYAHYGDANSQNFQMEGYPPPPPAYHNAEAPPPTYQPPPGATKAMADQSFRETTRAGEGSGSGGVGNA